MIRLPRCAILSKCRPARRSFFLDLTDTGLSAGDEVIVIGFWDTDYNSVFPELSVGDVLGVYAEPGRITPAIELAEGGNTGIELTINREVFDFEASVSGEILGDDTGAVTLVGVCGRDHFLRFYGP